MILVDTGSDTGGIVLEMQLSRLCGELLILRMASNAWLSYSYEPSLTFNKVGIFRWHALSVEAGDDVFGDHPEVIISVDRRDFYANVNMSIKYVARQGVQVADEGFELLRVKWVFSRPTKILSISFWLIVLRNARASEHPGGRSSQPSDSSWHQGLCRWVLGWSPSGLGLTVPRACLLEQVPEGGYS